ncbi:hypothetical protein N8249_05125 [Flavobacteriaceae bacterium]|jgi:hypothetical protein|nr:hypothetical protein [Flavobacteriaceae bacterium]
MKEKKIKHLEFIQNIITRMNTNSFQVKGMAITIVSALLVIYASEKNPDFLIISIFPIFLFWFLDAYYLTQERKFRGLYNDLLKDNIHNLKPFEMRPDLYKKGKYSFWSVLFSKTIWTIYLTISVIIVLIYLYLKIKKNG